MTNPKTYAKAIYGGLVAGLAAAAGAMPSIDPGEAITIATSIVVGFGAVYFATNQEA